MIMLHKHRQQILLYYGKGVDLSGILHTVSALYSFPGIHNYRVRIVGKKFIATNDWAKNTALLIISGGRSLPHYQELGQKGNQRIIEFVNDGGKYLGICAGGYYGCSQTLFEIGTPLELRLNGPLDFFPGRAIGPAFGNGLFRYHSKIGARAARVDWLNKGLSKNKLDKLVERDLRDVDDRDGAYSVLLARSDRRQIDGRSQLNCPIYSWTVPNTFSTDMYFNGGAYFEDAHSFPQVTVLSRFMEIENTPAAIVACTVGKGLAILTGIHPEMRPGCIGLWRFSCRAIYDRLRLHEKTGQLLWCQLLEYALK